MNYPLSPQQVCLLAMAKTTWRRRSNSKRRGLPFHEESITETVLQDLAEAFPGELVIQPFNKHQEGENGADWAWAFQNADKSKSVSMLVQAKALDLKDKDYSTLFQKAPPSSGAALQIDLLIQSGIKYELPPVYVFYNHLGDPNRIPDHCGTLSAAAVGFPLDSWGISIADAYRVRAEHPKKSFTRHRLHSMPLHCLLCSTGSGDRPSPDAAEAALQELRFLNRIRVASPRSAAGIDRAIRDAPPLPQPRSQLPAIFQRALEVARRSDDIKAEGHDELAEAFPGVAGVVILTDPRRPMPRGRSQRPRTA